MQTTLLGVKVCLLKIITVNYCKLNRNGNIKSVSITNNVVSSNSPWGVLDTTLCDEVIQ